MAASRTIIQTFCIVIVLSISGPIDGQTIVTVSPPSIAAGTNEQNVVISCSVQNLGSNDIVWKYSPSWSQVDVDIFSSFYNITYDTVNFTVANYLYESLGVQYEAADLTIRVAKPGQAATYTCSLVPATQQVGSSSLTVLDPIQCPPSDETEYTVGTIVNMSCSVNFYQRIQPTNAPTIQIYRIDPPILVPVIPSGNETTITVTASRELTSEDDGAEYMCIVSFANNNPDYSDNCTMIYYVLHEVSEITFEPPSSADNPTTVAVGEYINCTANGRPAPTITWYNDQGDRVAGGEQLEVTEEMKTWTQPVSLLCIANNSIDGGFTYASVEGNYTFIVGDAILSVQSAGTEAWVIAVAVIVPIVILAAIGVAIFFIIRHRKTKKATKKTTNGSAVNHATTTTTTSSSYSPVATGEIFFTPPNRPPPTSAPRTTPGTRGPPGPDNRNGAVGDSPGFGDLGVQTYGGSTQAMNAYPGRNSAHGSNQALGMGVSMNPNPGYPVRASNPVLNASVSSSSRPNYPYPGSNSNLNASLTINQNPTVAPAANGFARQPSIASSSGRSHASSYNAPAVGMNRYPNDLSSMHGSEV